VELSKLVGRQDAVRATIRLHGVGEVPNVDRAVRQVQTDALAFHLDPPTKGGGQLVPELAQAAAKSRPLSRTVEAWRQLVRQRRTGDAVPGTPQGSCEQMQPEEREYLAVEQGRCQVFSSGGDSQATQGADLQVGQVAVRRCHSGQSRLGSFL